MTRRWRRRSASTSGEADGPASWPGRYPSDVAGGPGAGGVLAEGDPDEQALVGALDGGYLGGDVVAQPADHPFPVSAAVARRARGSPKTMSMSGLASRV